ncbi:MAG: dual specificity protein phosphatase family protein [Actinobacteria bacterium]|nr:dual specificity protein phosphatase family protein [Actinomycetota bacterium]
MTITQLTETLWTGGDLPDDGTLPTVLEEWQTAGIGVIVDCRIEWSDEDLVAEYAPRIRYEHLGIDDVGQHVAATWFDQLVEAARPRTDDPAPGVLVHCHMGINRGPSGAFALLLASGLGPVEAIELIRTRRPIAGVSYAEDALAWWHERNATPPPIRAAEAEALARWCADNPIGTIRIMRSGDARGA